MSSAASIRVTGTDAVKRALAAFGSEIVSEVSKAVEASALEALTDVRKAIQGPPKTGREYRRGTKTHRASAPGQAPATDTGALVSSTYITKVDDYTQAIGSRLDYAVHLEFGTVSIAPRPAWLPAAERAAPRLQKRLRRIIAMAKAKAERTTK